MSDERQIYLPFKCPSCGVNLKIKADRLNQQYGCKNCEKKFYINRTGDMVIGPRPAGGSSDKHGIQIDSTGPSVAKPKKPKKPPLINLTPKAQMGIAVACVSLLIFGTIQFLPASGGANLPTTLKGRAQYVCDAVVQNDMESLKPLVSSSTHGSIRPLVQVVRSRLKMRPADVTAKATAKVLFQSQTSGKAGAIGRIELPIATTPTDDPVTETAQKKEDKTKSREFEFMMHWTIGSDKQWILDANETVKEMGGS